MSGPHRMEEFKYFRGGATLVISLDGLSWFSRRRCSDKGFKRWDDELQSWMSSGQMTRADEGPQSIPHFCTLDQRGSATVHLRKNTDRRSSLITQSPSLSLLPRHCCHLREPIQRSAFTSPLNCFVINFSQTVTGTSSQSDLIGIFRLIRKDLNFWTTDEFKSFIIICDAAIPKQLFRNIGYSEDGRTFIGNAGCRFSDKHVSSDLKKVTLHSPCGSSDNGSQDSQTEMVHGDYFPRGKLKSLLKSCQNCDHSGVSSESNGNVKTSKRVSFSDDVIVYMFNQDRPTSLLHSEPCTSQPSSYSCNLSDATSEDCGLEWEDDFLALERNCRFQCVRHTQDYTFTLPTPRWTSLSTPERSSLSQTCLFLTHVTESDLEL